jgi:hypothetical protein
MITAKRYQLIGKRYFKPEPCPQDMPKDMLARYGCEIMTGLEESPMPIQIGC